MKVNKEMVEYWYGETILPKDVLQDIIDIANGDYKVETLKSDIKETWGYYKTCTKKEK
jgi:hypothetical protein